MSPLFPKVWDWSAFLRGRGKCSEARGCPGLCAQVSPLLHYNRGYILLNTWNSAFCFYPLCFRESQSNALHPTVSKQNKHLLAGLFPILTLLNHLVRDSVCVHVCARVCLCVCLCQLYQHMSGTFSSLNDGIRIILT